MTNIELLPLPRTLQHADDADLAAHVQDYARANVAHATAAKDAEIEALRDLCGAAYQLAGVHDAPEAWLDALSDAAEGRPFSAEGLLPYMPDAVCEAEARAERLAEALQWYAEQAEGCRKIGSIGEPFRKELDRDGGNRARAALRDHEREARNG